MARTRRKRSRYSGSCLRRSCCSTWSVYITGHAIAVKGGGATLPQGPRRFVGNLRCQVAAERRGAWSALAACAITIVLAAGSRTSLAAFLRPIESDLNLERSVLSTAGALTVLTYGLAQPLVGALAARYGPRNVMLGGVLLTALGGFGVSTASQPWQLYLFAGILPGLAFAGASSVPATVLLAGWFTQRLGLATGIISAAIPAGQSLFVPLATALIPALGWRQTYILLGISVLVVGVPILLALVRDPPILAAHTPA